MATFVLVTYPRGRPLVLVPWRISFAVTLLLAYRVTPLFFTFLHTYIHLAASMPCGVQPTSLERRSNSFLTSRRVAQTSVLSPGSLTHSASTLSLLRYLATSTQASFKHRNSQLALSSSYLTSCCRTHDNNPTCAHSTPAQHRAVTGAIFTMCVCAWRASALSSPYARKICHAVTDRPSKSAFWSVRPSGVH